MSLLVGKDLTRSNTATDVHAKSTNSFSPQRKSLAVYSPDRDFFEDSANARIEPVCWRKLEDHREAIFSIFSVLTGGLLSLFSYRYSKIHMYLAHSKCSPEYAEIVEVRIKMITDQRVKTFFAKVERQMMTREGVDGKQKKKAICQFIIESLFLSLSLCIYMYMQYLFIYLWIKYCSFLLSECSLSSFTQTHS